MHSGKSEGEKERMGRMERLLCYRSLFSLFFPVGHSLSSVCIAFGGVLSFIFPSGLLAHCVLCSLSLVCHGPSYKKMHTATRFTETRDKKQTQTDEQTDREQAKPKGKKED